MLKAHKRGRPSSISVPLRPFPYNPMGKICIAIFRGLRHREALAEKLITPSSPSRGICPYSAFANARNPSYITPVFDSENLKCQRYVFLREFSTKPENEASRGLKSLKGGKIGKSVSKDTEGRGNEKLSSLDPAEINMKYDSEALFKEMHQSYSDKKKYEVTRRKFSKIFKHFKERRRSREPAQATYINSCDFPRAAKEFKSFFLSRANVDVLQYLSSLGPGAVADSFLSPIFTQFCQWKFPSEIEGFRGQLDCADLTKAHAWFPLARAMRRKIIYHCGPTNSGKTYNALQRFMDAQAGLYCGPLRLLAMEVFDKVNAQGVCCSLHTGQERRDLPFAKHVSCTVEMASTSQCYEVAVIDEIQMITDEYRGFAWSRALLGLQADEIHICGDPSVRQLIKDICAVTGDTLIENHYPRFKPLVVEAKTLLGNLQNVEKGDCIVAFSRREIFEIKMAIESLTSHRCCVIYGALPPETRTLQANLFNDPVSGYDVLVATDAVGMGLNLSIRRVVFYSLGKFTGDFVRPIPPSQVKQIAGRAGRRGSAYPEGLVTTFKLEDLDYLIECLKQPSEIASKAGLFPSFQQFKPFAKQFSDISFPRLLERFWECCRLDRHYFLCKHDNVKTVACMLEKVPGLSLEDRFNFCFAPVNTRDPEAMNYLRKFATDYSKHCPVRIFMDVPEQTAMDDEELSDLESKHLVLSVYLWLAHQFNHAFFPFTDKAESSAANIAHLLGESLANFNQEVTTPSENEAEESDAELIKQRFAELRELVTKQLAKKWRS